MGHELGHVNARHTAQQMSRGMVYMTQSGYGTDGMVGLMTILNSLHKGSTDAVSLLFATHPMSQERYDTAVAEAGAEFAAADYVAYLKQVNQGDQAQYAYNRLVEWGVIKPTDQ